MPSRQQVSPPDVRPPSVLVALPGTGSDGDYAGRAFAPVAAALGIPIVPVDPGADGIATAYRRALDAAAADPGAVLVAGVSIGGCVAVDWARGRAECVGVLAAMPPWVGDGRPDPPPAAYSASITAELIDRIGPAAAIEEMVTSSPDWLGAELRRSWTAIGAPLRAHLLEAAGTRTPTVDTLAGLAVPLVIVSVEDDPIHPREFADAWAHAAPRSTHRTITFDDWGSDPAAIGRAALAGWTSVTRY